MVRGCAHAHLKVSFFLFFCFVFLNNILNFVLLESNSGVNVKFS